MRDLLLQAAGVIAVIVSIAHGVLGETKVFTRATITPVHLRTLLRLVWQAGTVAWIAGGISAAALVGGVIFGLQAVSSNSDLHDEGCADHPCDNAGSRADTMESQMTTADLLFATAVVAGATAAVLYWKSAPAGKPKDGEAAPSPAPAEVGLAPAPGGGLTFSVAGRF